MAHATIPQAIDAIARGEIVVVADDEDRENEGDLIMAAEHATPEAIAFFVRHTSGLICSPITADRARELDLPLMVPVNTESMRTAFTVTVDLRHGTTTGISASDRARNSSPMDFCAIVSGKASACSTAVSPASRPVACVVIPSFKTASSARRSYSLEKPSGAVAAVSLTIRRCRPDASASTGASSLLGSSSRGNWSSNPRRLARLRTLFLRSGVFRSCPRVSRISLAAWPSSLPWRSSSSMA